MRPIVHILFRSQQPGRPEELVKFAAARRALTAATNVDRAAANRAKSHKCGVQETAWWIPQRLPRILNGAAGLLPESRTNWETG
jgi:hypothetical protein